MPQQLDYRTPNEIRPKRGLSEVAVALGVLVAGWSGVGAVFVEGAIERGDPRLDHLALVLLLMCVCGGVTAIVLGIRNLLRR